MSEQLHHLHEETTKSRVLLLGERVVHYLFPRVHDHYVSRAKTMADPWSPETTKIRIRRERMLVALAEKPGPGVVKNDDLLYYDVRNSDQAHT